MVERYAYDSFGAFSVLTASWGSLSGSNYDWKYLHQGLRWQTEIGGLDARFRILGPMIGRFFQMDPAFFFGGDTNLYRAVKNSPTQYRDRYGLAPALGAGKEAVEAIRKDLKAGVASIAKELPGAAKILQDLINNGDFQNAQLQDQLIKRKTSTADELTEQDKLIGNIGAGGNINNDLKKHRKSLQGKIDKNTQTIKALLAQAGGLQQFFNGLGLGPQVIPIIELISGLEGMNNADMDTINSINKHIGKEKDDEKKKPDDSKNEPMGAIGIGGGIGGIQVCWCDS